MLDNISKGKLKEFGLLVGFIFPIVIGFIIPLIFGHSFRFWTLLIGLPLIILSLIKPISLRTPYKIWIKIGFILGWVNSRLILGLVFILVLIPIALIMKILRHDPLRKNLISNLKSYREVNSYHKNDVTKIF